MEEISDVRSMSNTSGVSGSDTTNQALQDKIGISLLKKTMDLKKDEMATIIGSIRPATATSGQNVNITA